MSAKDEDLQRVQDAVDVLIEHFDSVQILATKHEPEIEDGTVHVSLGAGNWYARYGQAKEWLLRCDETAKQRVRNS